MEISSKLHDFFKIILLKKSHKNFQNKNGKLLHRKTGIMTITTKYFYQNLLQKLRKINQKIGSDLAAILLDISTKSRLYLI